MSSMRNVVPRRKHGERAQPKERSKWGLLEKHKDYSLRARDYSEKKKRLRILKQKVSNRNPDEFHFGMVNGTEPEHTGNVAGRGNRPLNQNVVKLLKTQDAAYLRTLSQRTRQLRRKTEQAFVFRDSGHPSIQDTQQDGRTNSKQARVVFVDTRRGPKNIASLAESTNLPESPTRSPFRKQYIEDQGAPTFRDTGNATKDQRLVSGKSRGLETDDSAESYLNGAQTVQNKRNGNLNCVVARPKKLLALRQRELEILAAEEEMQHQRNRLNESVTGSTKAGIKYRARARRR